MKKEQADSDVRSCTSLAPCHLTIIYDDEGTITGYTCASGEGDCFPAVIAGVAVLDFDDPYLCKAAKEIEQILTSIPPNREGRKLSFISTAVGLLLAWVEHDFVPPKGAKIVTQKSVGAEAFLKLIKMTDCET